MRHLFDFPNPVNEFAARSVAAGVVVVAVLALALRQPWLCAVLAYGFVARVLTGPTLSPLGQLASRIIGPRIGSRPVPGPPKRFAQGIGATVTVVATVLYFAFGLSTWTYGLLTLIGFFALLESALGFCVGCQTFGLLMRAGIIPESVCLECRNISLRRPTPA